MKNYWLLILGMMLVTFIPRLLPLMTLSERSINPLLKKFLLYIPYTALGALIVRGVMQSTSGMMAVTLVGIGVATALSWLRGGLILSVLSSIIAAFLFQSFF
jgi:branched-subunit amino acid transport protein